MRNLGFAVLGLMIAMPASAQNAGRATSLVTGAVDSGSRDRGYNDQSRAYEQLGFANKAPSPVPQLECLREIKTGRSVCKTRAEWRIVARNLEQHRGER